MKKLISFAMAHIIVFVGFACVMPRSFAAESGLLTYTVTDGKACITGTTGTITGDFTVPAEIDGYPVVEIGEGAFAKQTGLISVTISEGIETVGSDCFSDCYNLVKLTVSSTVSSLPKTYLRAFEEFSVSQDNLFFYTDRGVLIKVGDIPGQDILHYYHNACPGNYTVRNRFTV